MSPNRTALRARMGKPPLAPVHPVIVPTDHLTVPPEAKLLADTVIAAATRLNALRRPSMTVAARQAAIADLWRARNALDALERVLT